MRPSRFRNALFAFVVFSWGCSSTSGGAPHGSSGSAGTGGTSTGVGGQGSGGTHAGGASNGGAGAGGGGVTSSGGVTSGTGGVGGQIAGAGGVAVAGAGGGPAAGAGGSATGGVGAGGAAGLGSGGMSSGAGGGSSGVAGAGNGGGGGAPTGVTVALDKTHQTIEGFGLNTALSSNAVPWDTFFTTAGAGLGLSIVRVAMDENGRLNGLIPPTSYNAKIIGSPWTAGGSCKDNNDTKRGGHLLKSCYDAWSTTIASFAKDNGLYAMGAGNEPDFASCGDSIGPPCNGDYQSMVFTANEMVDFVKVLGPKLKNAGVKLLAPEPSEWLHLWSNTSATGSTVSNHPNSSDPLKCGCFANDPTTTGCASTCDQGNGYDYGHWLAKDATAWGLVDIVGTHEYDTQKALLWPADVDGGKRSKEVWQTEASGVMYWPEAGPSSDIGNGIAVAQWIHSALVVGEASAWLWWWYQATSSNDNEGLVLQSSSALTERCYTLGNYSKFVRPGYVMVEVAGNSNADLLLSAFKGSDALVIVAINKGSTNASVPIGITGGTAPSSCTPNVTSANDKLVAGNAVTVMAGTLTASLPGQSVTSFVCK